MAPSTHCPALQVSNALPLHRVASGVHIASAASSVRGVSASRAAGGGLDEAPLGSTSLRGGGFGEGRNSSAAPPTAAPKTLATARAQATAFFLAETPVTP